MAMSRRKFGTAAVAGGAAAALAPLALSDSLAGASVQSPAHMLKVASEGHLNTVTLNDALEVGRLGSRNLQSKIDLPSGEQAQIECLGLELESWTALTTLDLAGRTVGLTSTQRGFGLLSQAPAFELQPVGSVSLGSGLLVHYVSTASKFGEDHITIWQGEHSDVVSHNPGSLEDAVAVFGDLEFEATAAGVRAKTRRLRRVSSQLIVQLGHLLVEVGRPAEHKAPDWPGQAGSHGDFFRVDEEDAGYSGVAFVSDSAIAFLRDSGEGGSPISDRVVDHLVKNLRIDWIGG